MKGALDGFQSMSFTEVAGSHPHVSARHCFQGISPPTNLFERKRIDYGTGDNRHRSNWKPVMTQHLASSTFVAL